MDLLAEIKGINKEKVEEAFAFVEEQYKLRNGDVAFVFGVIKALLPLKPDEDTLITALLHDLYIFSDLDEKIIKERFGDSVCQMLHALKMLSSLKYAENDKSSQLEILRKSFFTMAKDLRVILVWLASRLSRMDNLETPAVFADKLKIARETMDVYVPIASRLGLYRIKTKLEDHSFRYLKPKEYESISRQVKQVSGNGKLIIGQISEEIKAFLSDHDIKADVQGRLKSIYSIYRKLKKKGLSSLDQLYDFFAIRVVLPVQKDSGSKENIDFLYTVLGLIHSAWKPVSSRFKDYVAIPKSNGYRSLHTVVECKGIDNKAQMVEIQIRDNDMHREAEYGVASHWLYKTKLNDRSSLLSHAEWIRGLEKIYDFLDEEISALKEVELNIFKDRIFVLTPRGEVKDLPVGAVPIDFAYSIHTDVGNTCSMAKVNGVTVPLDYALQNGDVVQIMTKKNDGPKLQWLSLVKTNFARQKIKSWFNNLNKEENIKEGKILLNKKLSEIAKPPLDHNYSILKEFDGRRLSLSEREALVEEVGRKFKLASDVVRKIYPEVRGKVQEQVFFDVSDRAAELDTDFVLSREVLVGGESGLPLKIASCCNPKIGSKIVAYITRGHKISIHRSECKLVDALDGERIVVATWKGFDRSSLHKTSEGAVVKLKTISRLGLMRDITFVISDLAINILDVNMKKSGSLMYDKYFLLDVDDEEKQQILLERLQKIDGVIAASIEKNFNS